MAICNGASKPLGFSIHGADQHETQCVEDVLEAIPVGHLPNAIFGDKAYDSKGLQLNIADNWEITLDAPLRKNSTRIVHEISDEIQEGRKSRWKIERLFSWLKSFRRTNIRWEYHPENFISWEFFSGVYNHI